MIDDNKRLRQRFLSTKEAAEYLGMSLWTVRREYPMWADKYGVKVSRTPTTRGNGKLRFDRVSLDRMMEQLQIK